MLIFNYSVVQGGNVLAIHGQCVFPLDSKDWKKVQYQKIQNEKRR